MEDYDERYDEEIGTRQSFPEVNAEIRRQLGLPPDSRSVQSRLERDLAYDDKTLRKAARIALLYSPLMGNSSIDIRRKLSALRSAGWKIAAYSNLGSKQLRGYYGMVRADILKLTKKRLPGELMAIEEENQIQY